MRVFGILLLAGVALLPAAEVIQSGTVAVTPFEDSSNAGITYANIRDALVTGNPGTTYHYRIKSLGASTKALTTAGAVAVVPGTTVVVQSSPGANQTTSLGYTPSDDQFTLFPTTSNRSTPPVKVCVVEVLDATETTLLATVDLTIDIQGVVDTREGAGGYYQSPATTPPAPIVIARGGSVRMNYVELAARCGWVDKERDGRAHFEGLLGPGASLIYGGSDGWSLAVDNNPGALTPPGTWPDAVFIKGTTSTIFGCVLAYGSSSDYSTDSLTIQIPANHPTGTFDLFRVAFLFDPDGPGSGAITAGSNLQIISVTVTASGGGSSGGGGSGGSGGCGVGALSSLLLLALLSFGLHKRHQRV